MQIVDVVFDPFRTVIQAYESLYSNPCEVHFTQTDEKRYAFTDFSDDPSEMPVIIIDVGNAIAVAVELLAHELAHVAVDTGCVDAHGPEWHEAFDAIHQKYTELVTSNIPEGFEVIEPDLTNL